jgi:hypothetical protein
LVERGLRHLCVKTQSQGTLFLDCLDRSHNLKSHVLYLGFKWPPDS